MRFRTTGGYVGNTCMSKPTLTTYFLFYFSAEGRLLDPQRIQLLNDIDTFDRENCDRQIRVIATMIPPPHNAVQVFFGKYNGDGWIFDLNVSTERVN